MTDYENVEIMDEGSKKGLAVVAGSVAVGALAGWGVPKVVRRAKKAIRAAKKERAAKKQYKADAKAKMDELG